MGVFNVVKFEQTTNVFEYHYLSICTWFLALLLIFVKEEMKLGQKSKYEGQQSLCKEFWCIKIFQRKYMQYFFHFSNLLLKVTFSFSVRREKLPTKEALGNFEVL